MAFCGWNVLLNLHESFDYVVSRPISFNAALKILLCIYIETDNGGREV
jgi:hypothetical protein